MTERIQNGPPVENPQSQRPQKPFDPQETLREILSRELKPVPYIDLIRRAWDKIPDPQDPFAHVPPTSTEDSEKA